MANSLGTLTVDLVAKIASFQADMGKAAKTGEDTASRISRAFKGLAIGAAVAGVAKTVADAVLSAVKYADALDNMSQRTGISVTELSRLRVAAQFSDTSIEDLQGSFVKLSKVQAEAASGSKQQAELFKSLGVATKNSDGSLRNTTAVLGDISDVFKNLGDNQGPTKAALAVEIFGKAGASIIPLLNQGSDGIKQFADMSDRLGLTLDSNTTTAAASFHDTLDTLKLTAEGLATQLAADLLPTLLDLAQGLADAASNKENVAALAQALRDLYDSLKLIKNLGSSAGSVLGALSDSVDASLQAAESFGKALGGDNSENISGPAKAAAAFKAAWSPVLDNIQKQGAEASATLQNFGKPGKFSGVTGGVVADQPSAGAQAAARAKALAALASGETVAGQGKAAAAAEALAKRIADAQTTMRDAIAQASEQLTKTGIPAVDAYNEALVKLDAQNQKFLDQGVPTKDVAEYESKMEDLAKAIEQASFQTEALTLHSQTLDLQAQAKDADAAAKGVAGLAVANRNYEKQLEALDKAFESNPAFSVEDYKAQSDALEALHTKATDDIKKNYDTASQFAVKAAENIQDSLADALSGEGVKGGFKGFLGGIADTLRKAAAQIVAADLGKLLFGDYGKTGSVGGLLGGVFGKPSTSASSGGTSGIFGELFGGGNGTATPYEAANIRNSEAEVTGADTSIFDKTAGFLKGLFGGFKATGGSVSPNMGYIVGEKGPEWFQPSSGGAITPNNAMRGGGGGRSPNNIYVSVAPTTSRRTAQQVAQATDQRLRNASSRNS